MSIALSFRVDCTLKRILRDLSNTQSQERRGEFCACWLQSSSSRRAVFLLREKANQSKAQIDWAG